MGNSTPIKLIRPLNPHKQVGGLDSGNSYQLWTHALMKYYVGADGSIIGTKILKTYNTNPKKVKKVKRKVSFKKENDVIL